MSETLWDALGQLSLQSQIYFALALFIAFAFEFVNGFHDTANAVATVVSTACSTVRPRRSSSRKRLTMKSE